MIETRIHQHDDKLTFERVQDCTPILENAKAMHKEGAHGSSEFRRAASFPAVLVERYCNMNNITFGEFLGDRNHVKAMCNDPSLSGFRIWPGKV
jgi:hypothetical protein